MLADRVRIPPFASILGGWPSVADSMPFPPVSGGTAAVAAAVLGLILLLFPSHLYVC